jgi:nickel-dependent lactate racemase
MTAIGTGSPDHFLTEEQAESIVVQGLDSLNLTGKRVLVIIPDSTRTMPLPMFFRMITSHLLGKASQLDFMVALGTHPAMSEEALLHLVGITAEEKAGRYQAVNIMNHAWKDPVALVTLGAIPSGRLFGRQ